MPQEPYELPGAVPPQLYPDDPHSLPPCPLWTAEQRQAAMEADRIASLQTPQPCGFWPQPQTSAFPITPQLPLCSTAGDIGTSTASSPHDHRTVVGLLGTPPIMQPQRSSPTPSDWGYALGSGHQNLTATQTFDPQPTEHFYHTLPSDQGLLLMRPFGAGELSQQTKFQEIAAEEEFGVQLIRDNPSSRSTYARQFSRGLPSQPAQPQTNPHTVPSRPSFLPLQTGLSLTQIPGAVPSSRGGLGLMEFAHTSNKETTDEEQTTPDPPERKRRKTAYGALAPGQAPGHQFEKPTPGVAFTSPPDSRVIYRSSIRTKLEQRRQNQHSALSTHMPSSRTSEIPTSSLSAGQTQEQGKAISKRTAGQPSTPARSSIGYPELLYECGICGQQCIRRCDFTKHEKKHQVEQKLPSERETATMESSTPVTKKSSTAQPAPSAPHTCAGDRGSNQRQMPRPIPTAPPGPSPCREKLAASSSLPVGPRGIAIPTGISNACVTTLKELPAVCEKPPLSRALSTPTAVPSSPISTEGGNLHHAGSPRPPATGARAQAQVPLDIPENPIPFRNSLPSIIGRGTSQPVTKYSMYFQPGGVWIKSLANGQVKRTKPFSLQDVLKASWAMHIVEGNTDLVFGSGGRSASGESQ